MLLADLKLVAGASLSGIPYRAPYIAAMPGPHKPGVVRYATASERHGGKRLAERAVPSHRMFSGSTSRPCRALLRTT